MKAWLGLAALVATVLSVAACADDTTIEGGGGPPFTTTGTGNSPTGGGGSGATGGVGATGGTGATAATGGTGATGAVGGGGGTPADCNVGDCGDCAASDCATNACEDELSACSNNSDCVDLVDCDYDCGIDPDCRIGCHETYADGVDDYYAMLGCIYCASDTCSQDCADYCPMEPPPTGTCDVGDCGTCSESDCTYFWCAPEIEACFDDQDCIDFLDCWDPCTTPECEYACHEDHAAGATLYYDLLNCMYCSNDTCAGDCADLCPIEQPSASPCDSGNCSDCGSSDCAYFWCSVEANACFDDAACDDFMTCYYACTDPQCEYDCHQDYAAGATLYYAFINCLYCDTDTCATDCVGSCPIEQPPAPPCDVGDCNTCVDSDCTYFWCSTEINAYFDEPDVQAFLDCTDACTDPQCDYDCHQSHATGATIYYELLNCLYCDTNTCSQDCAGYCPIEQPSASPCDVGDCDSCVNSECASYWCGAEGDACFGSQDCLDFWDCYSVCTTQTCVTQCEGQYPTGSTLFYAYVDCLYCGTDSCSQDCAAYCGGSTDCNVGDCDTCVNSTCADNACATQYDACVANQQCIDYYDCAVACGNDSTCLAGCDSQYPTGSTLFWTWIDCLYCDPGACSVDCAAYCGGGACDVGDCNTCLNSACAAAACDAELTACDDEPQCWDYVDCANLCTNNGCINGCRNQYPNGVAPGEAAMNCLLCDAATCSQDCAPYCPWP